MCFSSCLMCLVSESRDLCTLFVFLPIYVVVVEEGYLNYLGRQDNTSRRSPGVGSW